MSESPVEPELHQCTYLLMVLLGLPAQTVWSKSHNTCNALGRLKSDPALMLRPHKKAIPFSVYKSLQALFGPRQRRAQASETAYYMLFLNVLTPI